MMNLMKEDAVAEVLDVSVSTLRRWRTQGKGPVFRKLNGAVRYAADDLMEFANKHARSSTSAACDIRAFSSLEE